MNQLGTLCWDITLRPSGTSRRHRRGDSPIHEEKLIHFDAVFVQPDSNAGKVLKKIRTGLR